MFAGLDAVIAEVLTGRTAQGLMPDHPHEHTLRLHVEVAEAITGTRPADAFAAMAQIMQRTSLEVEGTWAGTPRLFL
jgi:DNA-binding FadR family transcriptional regulator